MKESALITMARWLMIVSVIALLLGPIILVMGAFSANETFMALALIIMGALGLYAGMKEVNRTRD